MNESQSPEPVAAVAAAVQAPEGSVQTTSTPVAVAQGTAGLSTQVGNQATTVSGTADATANQDESLVQADVDKDLMLFKSEDTPLMSMMLQTVGKTVTSMEVDHYMLDQPRSSVILATGITHASPSEAPESDKLILAARDKGLVHQYDTIRCEGVDGFDEEGKTKTPGVFLQLFVIGLDEQKNPIVTTCNGPKVTPSDSSTVMTTIPQGTKLVLLANALYETQKRVAPDTSVPVPERLYLQKRGMNRIVSDYFESQKKRIPFADAVIAEQAITNFKQKGNRTLWTGIQKKIRVDVGGDMGIQYIYMTKGIRYQFKREFQHPNDKWTYEEFIALAKTFYTGVDVPSKALCLCGKNFMESIQCIDFSKHPEVKITVTTNKLGWSVTSIHTVFGDFDFKREPTFEELGWSNCAALIGDNRLVHYVRKQETTFTEKVEGEEAKRDGILVSDALGLKGACHIWVDGSAVTTEAAPSDVTQIVMHNETTAPAHPVKNRCYYLLKSCAGINKKAKAGEIWRYNGSTWEPYQGEIVAPKSA